MGMTANELFKRIENLNPFRKVAILFGIITTVMLVSLFISNGYFHAQVNKNFLLLSLLTTLFLTFFPLLIEAALTGKTLTISRNTFKEVNNKEDPSAFKVSVAFYLLYIVGSVYGIYMILSGRISFG